MLAVQDNPPVRYPECLPVAELPGRWWVAHTKSRCEKALAWDLYRNHIGYFLPMVERQSFSGGRRRRNMAILFPSYVFFCGSPEARLQALMTNRLCQINDVQDQKQLRTELAAIEAALDKTGGKCEPAVAQIGRTCRVSRGALQGIEGVVTQANHGARLHLAVSVLGQSVTLEIAAGLLEQVA